MSHPLPADTLIGFHLRAPSSTGGKDYIIYLTNASVLHRRWGKTLQVNQHQQGQGNHRDLQQLVRQKQAKGYRVVDTYHAPAGWQSQQVQRTSDQARTEPRPTAPPQLSDPIEIKASSQHSLAWDF